MISLNKHQISATVKDRYAIVVYQFNFENKNTNGSNQLKFEITIGAEAFISDFEANIDGEIFHGQTKEKKTADKEYKEAQKKDENAVLLSQPYEDIPNVFEIKTNIGAKSNTILNITIEQILKKKFHFNQLNVEILRNFGRYNITCNHKYIGFKLNITDLNGIYDIGIPSDTKNVTIDSKTMDKLNQNCVIIGKILQKNYAENAMNELVLKYKTKGESNDSMVLYDNKSNTFCHIISDIITDSMINNYTKGNTDEGNCNNIDDIKENNKNILIPRRVVIVIDRSGSMGGIKWNKTILSTNTTLKQLRIGYDRYCIILCGNKLEYTPTNTIKLATNLNIKLAVEYLEKQQATGCELINDALLKAVELIKKDICDMNKTMNNDNYFMNQIIFITDGNPTIGETNTDKITLNVKNVNDISAIDKYSSKISIFSFGIGRDGNDSAWIGDLNHLFLRKLSLNNNGFYKRIKQKTADTTFAEYFTILSKPVLSNINVEYNNKNISNVTKTSFNTLYSGNDLIICGKINNTKHNKQKSVTLNATINAVTGKQIKENNKLVTKPVNITKNIETHIDLDEDCKSNQGMNDNNIERIWAYLQLKQHAENKLIINDMIEIDEDEQKAKDKIPFELAMKYRFVTPWTSMIVVKKNKNIFDEKDDEYGELLSTMEIHKMKLVTIGDSNCGKTSLILRFVDNIFNKTHKEVTMNMNCKSKKLKINNEYFNVSLWDTVGQEKYSLSVAPMYLRNANGIVFVCDINNMQSINNIDKWAKSINNTINFNRDNSILIVNKSDLIENNNDENAMNKIKQLTNNLGIDYVISSAKNNINVKNTFFRLIGSVYDTMFDSKLSQQINNNNNKAATYSVPTSSSYDDCAAECETFIHHTSSVQKSYSARRSRAAYSAPCSIALDEAPRSKSSGCC